MFDSLTELTEKIYLGEDSTIEFKRELPHRESLADEIAAFANANGGAILIGVDDDSEISVLTARILIGQREQWLKYAETTLTLWSTLLQKNSKLMIKIC